MTQLLTPYGPVEFVPRDFIKMPRNYPSATPTEGKYLRGVTIHYSGGGMAGYYAGKTLEQADEAFVARVIRNHCARTFASHGPGYPISDVGYQLLVGRSGICWEGRGVQWRNAANGALLDAIEWQYPLLTKTSNAWWQSIFLAVGTDVGFNTPTAAQWETARRLVAYNQDRFKIANCVVNGHRDVRATACPGDYIHARLEQLIPEEDDMADAELIQVSGDSLVIARWGLYAFHIRNRHPVDVTESLRLDKIVSDAPVRQVNRASYAGLQLKTPIVYDVGDPTPDELKTKVSDFLPPMP